MSGGGFNTNGLKSKYINSGLLKEALFISFDEVWKGTMLFRYRKSLSGNSFELSPDFSAASDSRIASEIGTV